MSAHRRSEGRSRRRPKGGGFLANASRSLRFARARRPVAIAMRAIAAALPADAARRGRRSVFSTRLAQWRSDEGVR